MNGREYQWTGDELDFSWWHDEEPETVTVLAPDKLEETKTLKASDLTYFTGTEAYYKFNIFSPLVLTDGTKYLADKAGAYWLMDEIAFAQRAPAVKAEYFQVWKLEVQGSKATLSCADGNDGIIWTKEIDFTDFPLPEITVWCVDNVILLPGEY